MSLSGETRGPFAKAGFRRAGSVTHNPGVYHLGVNLPVVDERRIHGSFHSCDGVCG